MLSVLDLRCEGRVDPLDVASDEPRLAWRLSSERRGVVQSAYRVLVSSTPELLAADRGDLWDSGVRPDADQYGLPYAGAPLEPGERAYWKVRVWIDGGHEAAWSERATWERALRHDDWTGTWIDDGREDPLDDAERYRDDPAPLFRRELHLPSAVSRARLHVTGLGWYEARINGRRVGERRLDPAWTAYGERVLTSTYDVTELLAPGSNCIGALVGSGWFHPLPLRLWGWLDLREHLCCGRPRLRVQLEVELEGGERARLVTDASWRTAPGPILRESVYLGEVHDARAEREGWDRPGFDDSSWAPAREREHDLGPLEPQAQPPVVATEELAPVSVTAPAEGVRVLDFGLNLSGVPRLRVRGARGARVSLVFGELLDATGRVDVGTSVCGQIRPDKDNGGGGPGAPALARQEDAYVLRGGEAEAWEPRFTWHAFRYVEVTGLGEGCELEGLTVLRLEADLERVGSFASSDERLERVAELCERTFRANLLGVQSDCPHRERFGYGADIAASCEAIAFLYDVSSYYAKVARDFADAQRANGGLTETAPFVGIADGGFGGGSGPPGWGLALPALLELLAEFYGDLAPAQEGFAALSRWLEFLEGHAREGLLDRGLSDWEALEAKPVPVTSTAYFHAAIASGVRLARALGRTQDERRLSTLSGRVARAFLGAFVDARTGRVERGTQVPQVHALGCFELPRELRQRVLGVLLEEIERRAGHLATGYLGTRLAFDVLGREERDDVLLRAVRQDGFPGWGAMLERGATTLWEGWVWDPDGSSHDHPALGSVAAWLFRGLGGISPRDGAAPGEPGLYALHPRTPAGLESVRCRYRTQRGPLACAWRRAGGRVVVEVEVPPNARVDLRLTTPDPGAARVEEPAGEAVGVARRARPGAALWRLGSGAWRVSVVDPHAAGR